MCDVGEIVNVEEELGNLGVLFVKLKWWVLRF